MPFKTNARANWQCFTKAWWRHQMETFSALLAICAGNSPVTGEYPAQRPVMRNFDVFFAPRLNKRLSWQSRVWWFETPSHTLWRHCNGKNTTATVMIVGTIDLKRFWAVYMYCYVIVLIYAIWIPHCHRFEFLIDTNVYRHRSRYRRTGNVYRLSTRRVCDTDTNVRQRDKTDKLGLLRFSALGTNLLWKCTRLINTTKLNWRKYIDFSFFPFFHIVGWWTFQINTLRPGDRYMASSLSTGLLTKLNDI